jgi:hypothetical protein
MRSLIAALRSRSEVNASRKRLFVGDAVTGGTFFGIGVGYIRRRVRVQRKFLS